MTIIRKAYKFRLKPNEEQVCLLKKFAGHTRFVWNHFLEKNLRSLERKEKIMWYWEMSYWTTFLKKTEECGFLKEAPAQALQQKLKDLEKAFKDCFDKKQPLKRLPRRKKKQVSNSFRFPESKQFRIENRRVFLPKLGWIGFYKSQKIKGVLKNATVGMRNNRFYISFQVEQEMQISQPNNKSIAIDLGVKQFAVGARETDYQIFEKPDSAKKYAKLIREQRKLSRKQKFSENWKKQKQKLQKQHTKISNTRLDTTHKISQEICKNHAIIFLEDLSVSKMSKSAKGNQEKPGSCVQQKAHLNKNILDQGWYMFRQQLEYKSLWKGGWVKLVNPAYTSQKCSCCGYQDKENRKTRDLFSCMDCGYQTDADKNAAKNILTAGLSRDSLPSESHKWSATGTCACT